MDAPAKKPIEDNTNTVVQQSGRKRQLEEVVSGEESSLVDNLTATIQDASIMDTSTDGPPKLGRLKLEAIFHPKFENETRTNKDIRTKMKQRVSTNKGYLEVSLKHSGSLLLWSGGQRFYSKNSTENQFTHVGEICLRQHFYRAYWESNKHDKDLEQAYKECSDYVEQHRLTLAFELVTDVLGHHGAIPHKDFLILTAVASKGEERFYSTPEVLALAQKFRLPHNDSWVFASSKSADALFELYDTTRETGLAKDTVQKLTASADAHVCSMYPHEIFQGDILEGIVIRYVPYGNQQQQGSDLEKDEQLRVLKQLAATSEEILAQVPPERPPCYELAASRSGASSMPPVLTINIRTIFQKCMKQTNKDTNDSDEKQNGRESFTDAVRDILIQSDGDNRRTVERWNPGKKKALEGHLPAMVKQLLDDSSSDGLDEETLRIAKMITTLDSLKQRADYKVLHEVQKSDGQDRWLCVVHIHWDATFQKFHKNMEKGDMPLFRGCCLELVTEGDLDMDESSNPAMTNQLLNSENGVAVNSDDDDTLMLKMKFLPYMVRTFGCRNGLNALKTGGPEAFDNFTMNLMTKWGTSEQAIEKWRPFFRAWGVYAYPRIQGQGNDGEESMLPLDNTFYLDHLERFSKLYYSGKVEQETSAETKPPTTFRGLVVVVALERETATRFAEQVAQALGGVRQCSNVNRIKDQDLINSRLPQGGGLVCSAAVSDGAKHVRKHLKKFKDSISIVLVDCTNKCVLAMEGEGKECTGLLGMAGSWRNTRCNVLEISGFVEDQNEDFNGREDIQKMLANLWEKSNAMAKTDIRPGLLVFFPGIPGCGKSTLCGADACKELERITKHSASSTNGNDGQSEPVRKILVLEGDKCKKKYWQLVQQKRGLEPASICVADKNVPPSAWPVVGSTCASTKGIAVPVLPDDASLVTTTVTGAKASDGSFNADIVHFYPFSLHYLAVCMARVLKRPSGSHSGKLDSATKDACMVVAKFYGLYRNVNADQFYNVLRNKIEGSGAVSSLPPIRVPFFVQQNLPPLPSDLEAALQKALQLQFGLDKSGKDTDFQKDVDDMESELRSLLEKHSTMLDELIVDEKESQKSFLIQTEARVKQLDSPKMKLTESIVQPKDFIKIVSVDVGIEKVHEILGRCAKSNPSVSSFLDMATEGASTDGHGILPGNNFVKNTHVTMAHSSGTKQDTLHKLYDAVVGHSVEVSVTGFLWSDSVAALSASVAPVTDDEQKAPVQASLNSFTHITVWHHPGLKPFLSNELPKMAKGGKAERLDFDEPIILEGVISYWSNNKSSS